MKRSRPGKERRQHPRFPIRDAEAVLTPEGALIFLGTDPGNKALGAVDLSEGGTRLRTRRPVPLGAAVRVTLEFEEPRGKVDARGEVRWSRKGPGSGRGSQAGVMFVGLPPDQARTIRRLKKKVPRPRRKGPKGR